MSNSSVSRGKKLLVVPPTWFKEKYSAVLTRVNSLSSVRVTGELIAGVLIGAYGGVNTSIIYNELVRDGYKPTSGDEELIGHIPHPVDADDREIDEVYKIMRYRNTIPINALRLHWDLVTSLPDHDNLLYDYYYFEHCGYNTIRVGDVVVPKEPVQALKALLEAIGFFIQTMLIPKADPSVVKMLELTYAVHLFGPVFASVSGLWPQTVLDCSSVRMCDVLLGMFQRALPYTTSLTMSPRDLIWNRLLFTTYILYREMQYQPLGDKFLHIIFTNEVDNGGTMPGGVAILTTDGPSSFWLKDQVCRVRPLLCKERLPTLLYISGEIRRPEDWYLGEVKLQGGGCVETWDFTDIAFIQTTVLALYLLLAYTVNEVTESVLEKAKHGSPWNSVPTEIFDMYWRHIVMAELLGDEYTKALIQYVKTYGNTIMSEVKEIRGKA